MCVVCDEECASRIEFERKIVVFSAMQARQTTSDDDQDDNRDDDWVDEDRDENNHNHEDRDGRRRRMITSEGANVDDVFRGRDARGGCNGNDDGEEYATASARAVDGGGVDANIDGDDDDVHKNVINVTAVREDGLIYRTGPRGRRRSSGTECDENCDDDDDDDDGGDHDHENSTLLMDDLNVTLYRKDDDALMNIDVLLRWRCRSCGMDIENNAITVPGELSCSYCNVVAPKLYKDHDGDIRIVPSSSTSSSSLVYDSSASCQFFDPRGGRRELSALTNTTIGRLVHTPCHVVVTPVEGLVLDLLLLGFAILGSDFLPNLVLLLILLVGSVFLVARLLGVALALLPPFLVLLAARGSNILEVCVEGELPLKGGEFGLHGHNPLFVGGLGAPATFGLE